MTETSPVATFNKAGRSVIKSCGRPLPNIEMKIVDLNTGEALGPNERGELCVKGPLV